MSDIFNRVECISKIKTLTQLLGLRCIDICIILNEDQPFISHVFSGDYPISSDRQFNFLTLIKFLENKRGNNLGFNRSIKETARMAAKRRKKLATIWKVEFHKFIQKELSNVTGAATR
jgi:hypothetical protein